MPALPRAAQALTALLPCISPGAAVLDVAGSEFILGPEEATLAQLGVTPAWRLEVQQGERGAGG